MRAILVLFLVFAPVYFAGATDLVPCGDAGQSPCQACHVVELIDNVYDWVVMISTILLVLFIAVAGLYLSSSAGDVAVMTKVRSLLQTFIIGYVILMTVWFVLDFGFRVLVGGDGDLFTGPWNSIECVDQPTQQPPDGG